MSQKKLIVVGGGLAGAEAAWQAASRGISVLLYEMRPATPTPAHKTANLSELVCSNSFGSDDPNSAPGLLKREMKALHSLIIDTAEASRTPAGSALAVDRDRFSQQITQTLSSHPNITILHEEVKSIPRDTVTILATGPLTSPALTEAMGEITQAQYLYFFDAISPIIDAESINHDMTFRASRYDKGGEDYLNCPMDEAEYDRFYAALMAAEKVVPKDFEAVPYFEGCLPIEVLAERGKKTPLFGPMKPVGLVNPKTGKTAYAIVQLRTENPFFTAYNMVGFQTKLKWPEQKKVFRLIPGLENAEFLRMGSIHRNTFINAPRLLSETLQLRTCPGLFMAGQIVGVEGYTESAAMGGLAGIYAARVLSGEKLIPPPKTTAHGALLNYITGSHPAFFQPININFGLFPPLADTVKVNKALRHQKIVNRAMEDWSQWIAQYKISEAT